jgi:restriction endonuclease S subunit
VDSGWVLAWTRTTDFQQQVEFNKSGTTMPRLPARMLESFDLPLSSMEHQREVGELVATFDAAIQLTTQQLAELKALASVEVALAFDGAIAKEPAESGESAAARPHSDHYPGQDHDGR